jgi:NHS family xanthosine MFS transporter
MLINVSVGIFLLFLMEITDGFMDDHYVFVVYGMAFDFFNISGSLFVETNTEPKNRSSAQGLS